MAISAAAKAATDARAINRAPRQCRRTRNSQIVAKKAIKI